MGKKPLRKGLGPYMKRGIVDEEVRCQPGRFIAWTDGVMHDQPRVFVLHAMCCRCLADLGFQGISHLSFQTNSRRWFPWIMSIMNHVFPQSWILSFGDFCGWKPLKHLGFFWIIQPDDAISFLFRFWGTTLGSQGLHHHCSLGGPLGNGGYEFQLWGSRILCWRI